MSIDHVDQVISVTSSTQVITVDPATQSVSVTNAGPQGPAGAAGSGGSGGGLSEAEVDTLIAEHDQAEIVHNNASSGRDFAALFTLGLV